MKATATKSTETQVFTALQVILKNRSAKALNYAVNYAREGMYLHGGALRVQVLYVLNNMTHWRGKTATEVRAVLKGFK